MGHRSRLIPVPPALLQLAGWLTGRSAEVRRLCGSLTLDIGPAEELGWVPAGRSRCGPRARRALVAAKKKGEGMPVEGMVVAGYRSWSAQLLSGLVLRRRALTRRVDGRPEQTQLPLCTDPALKGRAAIDRRPDVCTAPCMR